MQSDVVIIGAGPAGSIAAAVLATRGARVVIVDGSHPREKPCGGGYTGRALDIVHRFAPHGTFDSTSISRATFLDSPRQRRATVDLPRGTEALVVASRSIVDAALLEAAEGAGATLLRERVTSIVPGARHTIRTRSRSIDTPFVVGADGANSLVRRTFTRPFTRRQLSLATGVYAHGLTSDEILVEMVPAPAGYIWSFPRPDHLAIGICAQASDTTVGVVRRTLDRWLGATGIANGATLEPYSWPIPSLAPDDYERLPLAGDRWLTIGDAAGLVDPITREGIYFAMLSGMFAADALGSDTQSPHLAYAERVRREISGELATAARLKAGFFAPRFTSLLFDALVSSSPIRSVMADLVAGTQPYSTLKWRLAGTLEFGLAWTWWRQRSARPA